MEITINQVFYVVLTICLPFVVKEVITYAKTSTNGILSSQAAQAVYDAVLNVNQTYVNSLKKAGEFTEEAQEEARTKAVGVAVSFMSTAVVKYINKTCGSVEDYVLNKLESVVTKEKQGGDSDDEGK